MMDLTNFGAWEFAGPDGTDQQQLLQMAEQQQVFSSPVTISPSGSARSSSQGGVYGPQQQLPSSSSPSQFGFNIPLPWEATTTVPQEPQTTSPLYGADGFFSQAPQDHHQQQIQLQMSQLAAASSAGHTNHSLFATRGGAQQMPWLGDNSQGARYEGIETQAGAGLPTPPQFEALPRSESASCSSRRASATTTARSPASPRPGYLSPRAVEQAERRLQERRSAKAMSLSSPLLKLHKKISDDRSNRRSPSPSPPNHSGQEQLSHGMSPAMARTMMIGLAGGAVGSAAAGGGVNFFKPQVQGHRVVKSTARPSPAAAIAAPAAPATAPTTANTANSSAPVVVPRAQLRTASRTSKNANHNPPKTAAERRSREAHNCVEKQYRNRLNFYYQKLLEAMPDLDPSLVRNADGTFTRTGKGGPVQISRQQLLECAAERILAHNAVREALESQVASLQAQVEELRAMLALAQAPMPWAMTMGGAY